MPEVLYNDALDKNDVAIVVVDGNDNADAHAEDGDDDDGKDDDDVWDKHKRAHNDTIVAIDLISKDMRKDLEYECHMVRKLLVFIDACILVIW